jgi:hypothetical protein
VTTKSKGTKLAKGINYEPHNFSESHQLRKKAQDAIKIV